MGTINKKWTDKGEHGSVRKILDQLNVDPNQVNSNSKKVDTPNPLKQEIKKHRKNDSKDEATTPSDIADAIKKYF